MVNDYADFNTLKELLGATDGNLASHAKALEKVEFITSRVLVQNNDYRNWFINY